MRLSLRFLRLTVQLSVILLTLWPAIPTFAQNTGGGFVGLPPASTIIGPISRSPDGTIVVDHPVQHPSPSGGTALKGQGSVDAPNSGTQALTSPSPPSAGQPIEHSTAQAISFKAADTPDAWDEISCKSVAWEGLNFEQCRRDLKAARATKPAQ
jgi:hypothetical protein